MSSFGDSSNVALRQHEKYLTRSDKKNLLSLLQSASNEIESIQGDLSIFKSFSHTSSTIQPPTPRNRESGASMEGRDVVTGSNRSGETRRAAAPVVVPRLPPSSADRPSRRERPAAAATAASPVAVAVAVAVAELHRRRPAQEKRLPSILRSGRDAVPPSSDDQRQQPQKQARQQEKQRPPLPMPRKDIVKIRQKSAMPLESASSESSSENEAIVRKKSTSKSNRRHRSTERKRITKKYFW